MIAPAIFFGHGSPMNAIEKNNYTKTWAEIASTIPKPKAIICISAHWETEQSEGSASKLGNYQTSSQTNGTKITSNQKQKTIHDFYGFPKELYEVQYCPNGSPELAEEICNKISEITLDDSWGLDHGTWSILKHIYPNADIPTLQLSIDRNKTPQEHYDFAKKLLPLRREGVLIIGSGNIVHNLREIDWNGKPHTWAEDFSKTIRQAILDNDHAQIINYKTIKDWKKSVPTPEHFIPLLYILALKQEGELVGLFNDKLDLGSIDMTGILVKS